MKTCPACQNQVPDNAQFCDQCGMRLSDFPTTTDAAGSAAPAAAGGPQAAGNPGSSGPVEPPVVLPSSTPPNRCPACGASYIPGEAFCGECGAALTAPASAAGNTSAAAAAPPTVATPVAAAVPPAVSAAPAAAQMPMASPSTPGPGPAFITCSACGSQQMAGQAYCDECGASLSGAARGTSPAASVVSPAPSMPSTPIPMPMAPPAPLGQPRLVVAGSQATINLAGRDDNLIGRTDPVSNIYPEVDLTPHGGEDGGVSRRHARITHQGGQWMVEDLNSTNGTFLNGQRLAPVRPQPLKDGDALRLGKVQLSFRTG
ncbi:MAG: FHA domain-containing protein [Chloroflexi bacterium]|nr:FHA domain-containing protein [Chloroflexota bacterium]